MWNWDVWPQRSYPMGSFVSKGAFSKHCVKLREPSLRPLSPCDHSPLSPWLRCPTLDWCRPLDPERMTVQLLYTSTQYTLYTVHFYGDTSGFISSWEALLKIHIQTTRTAWIIARRLVWLDYNCLLKELQKMDSTNFIPKMVLNTLRQC